ncbi:MAG: OmpH family outer membrane protein [Candidatus Omnitrophota bacterium]|nr:OmpH family outer membrane protein [Candidatus Omnitrophota bacterium]
MFTTRRIIVIGMAGLLLLCNNAGIAFAQDGAKIGYVDFRRAFYENDKAKVKEEELRDYEEEQKKTQMDLVQEITQIRDEAELLSDEAKEKKRKEIEAKMLELQNFENDVRKELQSRKNDIYKEIADDIQGVVDAVGKSGGYDYILDSRSIIYTSKDYDITDEVIKNIKKKK